MEEYVWISKAIHIPIFTDHVYPIMYRLGQAWNVKVTIAGTQGLQDEPFIQAIYDALERKVAGIMLHGWGVENEVAAINTAIEQGIPVITVDSDVPNSKRLAHVGTDWFRMGMAMADQLASLVEEKGKVLLIGNIYLTNIQAGFRGFQYRMSAYPHIELFGPEDDSGMGDQPSTVGPDRANTVTNDWLTTHPDISGVAGFDFQAGPGIARALDKIGLAGKVKVVCVDAEAPHADYIKDGVIQAAFCQRREFFTYQAFQMIYAFNHGSASTGYQPGLANISGNIDTGFIVVTKGNVDLFEDEFNLNEVFEREAMTRRLALMSTVVESSGQMTVATDLEGQVIYANPTSLQLTGMTEDQIMGTHMAQLFNFSEEQRALIEHCVTTETLMTFETSARREDGHVFPVQLTVSSMQSGAAGRGLVLIAADISTRKQAEEAFQESEMRWQFALEGAGDGVWDWNSQTNEVFFSPQWKAMLGFDEHEIGNTLDEWDKRVHPEDKEATYTKISDYLAGKTPVYNSEHRILCKDGTYKWVLDRGKVIDRAEDGQPLRVIGTHTDITQRKQIEEALRKNEEYARGFQEELKALHEVNLELVTTKKVDILCKKAIELGHSVLGFDRIGLLLFEDDEHVSRFGIESSGELHAECNIKITQKDGVMSSGLLTNREAISVNEDTELRDFDGVVGRGWNVVTGIWDGDNCIGWLAADNYFDRKPLIPYQVEVLRLYGLTLGNLVTRKRAETEILRLNEELEQRVIERTRQLEAANSELEAFAYSVSHDLRAPLRAIDGFSQALLEDYTDQLDAEGRGYLERVRAGSQRMGQLIDDLLKLSRLTRQEMRHELVDLSIIAHEIAVELRELDPDRAVEFIIADQVLAYGDPQLLRVVMNNLLANAWKFTSRTLRSVIEFDSSLSAQSQERVYWIRDNGVGFDMAYADKLFGVFQRLHAHSEFEGTGIGLATVKRIVQRHGGRIWAEAEVNKGATIRFTLGCHP